MGLRRTSNEHSSDSPHTVVVIDRFVSANTLDEMSRKLRQPVLAFTSAKRNDDGESIIDLAALEERDRETMAGTLRELREGVLLRSYVPYNVDEEVKADVATLQAAVGVLSQLIEKLNSKAVVDDVATARAEADNVRELADGIAATLFSWELDKDETDQRNHREDVQE